MNLRSMLLAGLVGVGVLGAFGFNAGLTSLWSADTGNHASVTEQETAAGQVAGARPVAEAVEFKVDPTHSTVAFWIESKGVSKFYARFAKVSGSFTINPEDGVLSAVRIEIPAESIDTNSAGRDRHLKSGAFFDAKQFPTLSFVSTNVEQKSEDLWNVTGDFSMHGVTKTITIELEVTGRGKKGRNGYLGGIASEFVINRSEFGMSFGVDQGVVGDAVTIMVGLQGQGK